jgi:hypothetical protein
MQYKYSLTCTIYVRKHCDREKIHLEISTDINFIRLPPSDYEEVVLGMPYTVYQYLLNEEQFISSSKK